MGRMKPTSYGPTEHHLWLVGNIPTSTWESCREKSERRARTQSYDDLVHLFIEFAMDRENDSHEDKYLRKHREGRPLLRSVLEGGRLNLTLTVGRLVLGG